MWGVAKKKKKSAINPKKKTRKKEAHFFSSGTIAREMSNSVVFDQNGWWQFSGHHWKKVDAETVAQAMNTTKAKLLLVQPEFHRPGFVESLDKDPWTMGVANGILCLCTGTLRDGRPEDMVSLRTNVPWLGLDAPCPRFHRFLGDIFSPEATKKVLGILGYSLSGDTTNQRCFYHQGSGHGKGTLMDVMRRVAGDYAYLGDVGHPIVLRGKRLVIAFGQPTQAQLSNFQEKTEVTCRPLYKRTPVTFPLVAKLHAVMPGARLGDDNDIRYFSILEERDQDLRRDLCKELPGILACLVRAGIERQ